MGKDERTTTSSWSVWAEREINETYLKEYTTAREATRELNAYFRFYNKDRLHQSLEYRTPWNVYRGITVTGSQWHGWERMAMGGK